MHLLNLFPSSRLAIALGAFALTVLPARAGLLTPVFESKLEEWLGQGNLTFTNIYTSQPGHTGSTFHSAVDNQGATFTLIEVFGGTHSLPTQVIGGYNPTSWVSNNTYSYNPSAFIYNLTTLQRQTKNGNGYSVANFAGAGPLFGQGHDINIDGNLLTGYSYNYSYGPGAFVDEITTANTHYNTSFQVSKIEVYTFSAPVPDWSSTLSLLAVSLTGMLLFRRRVRAV